jgi:CDP-diacylglycerol pyrophosphatase
MGSAAIAMAAADSSLRISSWVMSMAVAKLRSMALIVCVGTALAAATQPRAANRDALRQIVEEQCVVHWLKKKAPAPCASVYLSEPERESAGYAVLADIKGGAHFLLIPTTTITGIESPEILASPTPNYFAAAWRARDELAARLGRTVARDAVGLAVNSQRSRTQDQLHIHIECLGRQIHRVLKAAAERLNDSWSPITLAEGQYQALRLMGEDFGTANPFVLLAQRMPGATRDMGAYTLMVAGMQFKDGAGFIVLTGKNVPGTETLLDSTCAIAARGRR